MFSFKRFFMAPQRLCKGDADHASYYQASKRQLNLSERAGLIRWAGVLCEALEAGKRQTTFYCPLQPTIQAILIVFENGENAALNQASRVRVAHQI
jgi:hypothetical protein